MDNTPNAAKKTLMNSYGGLMHRKNQLNSLERLSQRMIDKFNRIDDKLNRIDDKPTEDDTLKAPSGNVDSTQEDIMDLFNGLSNKIEKSIMVIEDNINVILDMID